ncbi:hypothetical protein GYMLUDRAFT_240713 [Collybiopsis luxurians FD-317 M1]|nr:hypothetical protein GYMLUDRAFT_240713 [Collybiopsis luxurians FD-317 M1]
MYTLIHNLPNEILCNLFLIVVHRTPGRFSAAELVLSHVCARWRSVSLALHPLWSSIFVLAHEDPQSVAVNSLIRLYLDRSGNAPLDLYIDVDDGERIFTTLLLHAHRWRSVHFFSTPTQEPLPLSSLESLSLSRGSPPYPHTKKIPTWSNAPRLHTLSLDLSFHTLSQFLLPWSHLHHLTLHHLSIDEMHTALRLSPALTSATFLHCTNDYTFRDPVPYTSPSLSSLTILCARRCETLGPDITHCAYPALQHLSIQSGSEEFSFSHGIVPDLAKLVLRSEMASLTRLTLHGISYTSKHLMDLLQLVSPTLIKLDLCDVDHRGWNFLQLERWLVRALIWVGVEGEDGHQGGYNHDSQVASASTASMGSVPGHGHGPSYTHPGLLLPRLKEFGIRFPGRRREAGMAGAVDLDLEEKMEALVRMVESRCACPSPSFGVGVGVEGAKSGLGLGTRTGHLLDGTGTGRVLRTLHLGRMWSTRMSVELGRRLRVLEERGVLVITAE